MNARDFFLVFKSRCRRLRFYFCPPFCRQFVLSPAAHERRTVYSSVGKDEDNGLSVVVIFLLLSLSHNKSERLKHSVWWRQRGFLLLFVSHREVVFQTQDYAHCDLPKHAVLAIFSRNCMKATLKGRMRLIRLCQGKKAPYLAARDL